MDIQELSDRAEIADLIVRYTRALDQRLWDEFDTIFAADAFIDYTAFGGTAGDLVHAKEFLAEMMPTFAKTQHMLGLPAIVVDGDRASSVTPCHNPMRLGAGKDAQIMVCALWYHHELLRTADGWRISRLSEERVHMTILPGPDIGAPD